jgi:hypothetical protein
MALTRFPNEINQAPLLPQVAPPLPPKPTANPFATSMDNPWMPAPPPKKRSSSGVLRRVVSWVLVIAAMCGIGYVGVRYGSDLVALATGDESVDESDAPMQFPTVTPVPVRTATYTVERMDPLRGAQSFEITTDFEGGVSRIVVDGGDQPDVEVLTFMDQALIRRVDQPNWYRLERGAFPIDAEWGRARWVRTIDELVPPGLRSAVTIDRSTESVIGSIPARRLLMSIDPATLFQATSTTPVPGSGTTPVQLAPGMAVRSGTDPVESLTVEAWVDSSGLVRKSVLPGALGGETITVTSVSAEPWQPVFPDEGMIRPITAAALFDLGL